MSTPTTAYTSVTMIPPANWSQTQPLYFGGVEITPSSGQYLFDSTTKQLTNEKLAAMLVQGWQLVSLTA